MDNDVNRLLLETKTASATGIEASEKWVTRSKKRNNNNNNNNKTSPPHTRKKTRIEFNSNIEPEEDNMNQTTHTSSASSFNNNTNNNLVFSKEPVEALVNRILEYVMIHELGGCHNIILANEKNNNISSSPSTNRAVIFAQTSKMRAAAGYHIHHVVYGGITSITQSEPAVEAIIRYRRKLHVCNYERDLVGGVIDGKAQHTLQHLRTRVIKGLRGESIDTSTILEGEINNENKDNKKKDEEVVILFDGVKEKKTLSSFLQDSSSSDSEE